MIDLTDESYQNIFDEYIEHFSGEEVRIYKQTTVLVDKYSQEEFYDGPYITYGVIGNAEEEERRDINGPYNARYEELEISINALKELFPLEDNIFKLITTKDAIIFRGRTFTIWEIEYTAGLFGGEPTHVLIYLAEQDDLDIEDLLEP